MRKHNEIKKVNVGGARRHLGGVPRTESLSPLQNVQQQTDKECVSSMKRSVRDTGDSAANHSWGDDFARANGNSHFRFL